MVPPSTEFLSPNTWVTLDDNLSVTPHIQSISRHIKSSPNISQICPFLYPHIYYSSQVSTMSPHHSFNNTFAATPHRSPYSDHGYITPGPRFNSFSLSLQTNPNSSSRPRRPSHLSALPLQAPSSLGFCTTWGPTHGRFPLAVPSWHDYTSSPAHSTPGYSGAGHDAVCFIAVVIKMMPEKYEIKSESNKTRDIYKADSRKIKFSDLFYP